CTGLALRQECSVAFRVKGKRNDAASLRTDGAYRRLAILLMRDMTRAAVMPDLRENHATVCMHCIGHPAPAVYLLRAVDTRREGPAALFYADGDTFGDDQASAGTL